MQSSPRSPLSAKKSAQTTAAVRIKLDMAAMRETAKQLYVSAREFVPAVKAILEQYRLQWFVLGGVLAILLTLTHTAELTAISMNQLPTAVFAVVESDILAAALTILIAVAYCLARAVLIAERSTNAEMPDLGSTKP